ncbi:uncharacterized protein PV07_03120 [Cladophialophora immunda]|uniref:Nitroreductase domain-containing protein n=1 Tax=Cladophialophora immunda TaxID=569365 RepID=A0A0D2CJZ5_9EURO|nr:uncharacterized protein PV07_03120 [Cladophialophora immunda]KIW31473.1 hypothetical protein PV07_03120 [Cladophialophora immunda]OQV11352.1 hypothetical protein CLAIMM_15198 [Cladophialophora immunda]
MASSPSLDLFLSAVASRISCYALTKHSPIPDSEIHSIVQFAINHTPSTFNVQSARAVVLLHAEHEKLWDIGDASLRVALPEQAYQSLAPKVLGFKAGYGTVLWFEDEEAMDKLKEKSAGIQHLMDDWSLHSSGMHQFVVWTALELKGLGCNLQHYNFMPDFSTQVAREWKLPDSWKLQSQLVFGAPKDGHLVRSRERTYLPLEERVKIFV